MAVRVVGPIVRFVSQTTAAIWVEFDERCAVTLLARPLTRDRSNAKKSGEAHLVITSRVGHRHFAIAYLTDLVPATLYRYQLVYLSLWGDRPSAWPTSVQQLTRRKDAIVDRLETVAIGTGPVFRTLAPPRAEGLRVAFGSCRKWLGGASHQDGADVIAELASWLADLESRRLTEWPHFLLLLGDQIYADDVAPEVQRYLKRRRREVGFPTGFAPPTTLDSTRASLERQGRANEAAGAKGFQLTHFEEFAYLYATSWRDDRASRVFANLPVFMMLDDHEITDDLNLTGGWVEQMEETGAWPLVVADGLAAYWVYQGWGNLDPETSGSDERVKILQHAAETGSDALAGLQELLLQTLGVEPMRRLAWYYEIPSSPPVVVLDTRNDHLLSAPHQEGSSGVRRHVGDDDLLLSAEQFAWFETRLRNRDEPVLVGTGVPFLQPRIIDQIQLMVTRTLGATEARWELASQGNADLFENLRRMEDTDSFSAFPASFFATLQLLAAQTKPVVFLSGDVHFSYAVAGEVKPPKPRTEAERKALAKGLPRQVYQIVSSPLQNQRSDEDARFLGELLDGEWNPAPPLIEWLRWVGELRAWPRSALPAHTLGTLRKGASAISGVLVANNIAVATMTRDRRRLHVVWKTARTSDAGLMDAAEYQVSVEP